MKNRVVEDIPSILESIINYLSKKLRTATSWGCALSSQTAISKPNTLKLDPKP